MRLAVAAGAVVLIAGCSAPAPAPAVAAPQVPPPVYVTITVGRSCAGGTMSVSVSHVAPADAAMVRQAITAALGSAAERRLARVAVCRG